MSDKPSTDINTHKNHTGKTIDHESMNQIRNVDYAGYATLARCGCNWFGWIDNSALEKWLNN
jgi:hypothetical protein